MRGEPRLDVDRLELRLPGDGRHVAEAVAGELARRLEAVAPTADRDLGRLSLQVSIPADASATEVARRVAAAIGQALR